MVILHTGTNEISNKVNTFQKVTKVISAIKEHDTMLFIEEMKVLKSKTKHPIKYFFARGMQYVNNNNIDSTCLHRNQLHLNKSGTTPLTKNFSKVVNSGRYFSGSGGKFYNNSDKSTIMVLNRSQIGNLRLKN